MKTSLGARCDEFFTNCRLFFKMDLSLQRETVLHFFERVRREYPELRHFRRREVDNLILEEKNPNSRDTESRRWIRLDDRSMRFGHFDPPSREDVRRYANFLLYQAPFHLTINDLDMDRMEVLYGFDLEYAGNHDQLVADTSDRLPALLRHSLERGVRSAGLHGDQKPHEFLRSSDGGVRDPVVDRLLDGSEILGI